MPTHRIAEKLFNEPWAIQKEWLQKMVSIADRESDLEALEARLGKPLDYAYEATVRGTTAVIPIDGPIFPKANILSRMSGAVSLDMIAQDFQEAVENDSIESIALTINSPGGYITGIDEMHALIKGSPKPVYAHVSGIGASAAYWLASAATEVSITPTSSVGSIGVVQVHTISEDDERTIEFVSSVSPRKRLDPETEEGRAEAMDSVNKVAEVFVDNVAKGRDTSPEDVIQNFGQGGMLTGQQAVDAGMADNISTFEELMARLSEQETSSYGEYPMNVDELKAEHPKVYEAIKKEGLTAANTESADQIATLASANETLTAENTQLKEDFTAAGEENKENSKRIQSLEKNETIRQAKATADLADTLANAIIGGSDIPASLHSKVRACVNHEDSMEEGVFDKKAFSAAVETEVADWTASLEKETPLAGFGASGAEAQEDSENEKVTDKACDSLMSHLK